MRVLHDGIPQNCCLWVRVLHDTTLLWYMMGCQCGWFMGYHRAVASVCSVMADGIPWSWCGVLQWLLLAVCCMMGYHGAVACVAVASVCCVMGYHGAVAGVW